MGGGPSQPGTGARSTSRVGSFTAVLWSVEILYLGGTDVRLFCFSNPWLVTEVPHLFHIRGFLVLSKKVAGRPFGGLESNRPSSPA